MSSTAQATSPGHWQPPPGSIGNLTIPQQHSLENFRKELQDRDVYDEKRHDDATLLRFLRARKFNLEAAITMILNYEEWRKTYAKVGVDELLR